MKKLRAALIVLGLVLLAGVAGFLDWSLPHHAVLRITGDEVKRLDMNGKPLDASHAVTATRDVYFINAVDARTHDVAVFHNQDTGWGFPWYFKFDSAEVQGRAQMLAHDPSQRALVTYYGWRIPMLDAFPNAVDVQPWDRDAGPFPWFNVVLLAVLLLIAGYVWWKLHALRQRRAGRT